LNWNNTLEERGSVQTLRMGVKYLNNYKVESILHQLNSFSVLKEANHHDHQLKILRTSLSPSSNLSLSRISLNHRLESLDYSKAMNPKPQWSG